MFLTNIYTDVLIKNKFFKAVFYWYKKSNFVSEIQNESASYSAECLSLRTGRPLQEFLSRGNNKEPVYGSKADTLILLVENHKNIVLFQSYSF